jgi:hypothetical protein
MATTTELLLDSVRRLQISREDLIKRVTAETLACHRVDAAFLVDRFLSGEGTPVVVATAVIDIVAAKRADITTGELK